ncbi:VCBS repeat-containing protein [Maridesulfovibrio sp.]|uniref:VCBS repeat-containing protein n=1 Tax=Maridesulfovibrio sp. TaxID=2795000 RepID=UPI002A18BD13|nr:VCBS repeat-containing protein [Maridesulfovibrio sp.]
MVVLSFFAATASFAAEARTYAVYPFEVNGPEQYKYLSRGIQTMLISRLNWTGHFEPVAGARDLKESDRPKSAIDEIKSAQRLGTDYLALGSITIMGKDASIDLRMVDKDGKSWPQSAKTTISELIPALDDMAKEIKGKLFEKPGSRKQTEEEKAREDARPSSPVNPEFLSASTAGKVVESTINPQFRYQGGTDTPGRWRSQSVKVVNLGGFVADVTGDGKNDVVVLTDKDIKVFRIDRERLVEQMSYSYPSRSSGLRIFPIDTDRDGVKEVVLTVMMKGQPYSYILSFKGGTTKVLLDRDRNFLSVIRIPPNFTETIVGQRVDSSRTFYSKDLVEYAFSDGRLVPIKSLTVPSFANVYNLTYLPQKGDDYKVLVINKYGRINMYDKNLEPLYESQDSYNSVDVKVEVQAKIAGMGNENAREKMENYYFLPMPVTVATLSDPTKKEVLLNKDLSVAGQVFSNYKSYAQGELQSEYWDGVGLSLAWKTRRIKGSITSYGIADIDNDGDDELYCILNTYPGSLGVKFRKTLVIAYELNLGRK